MVRTVAAAEPAALAVVLELETWRLREATEPVASSTPGAAAAVERRRLKVVEMPPGASAGMARPASMEMAAMAAVHLSMEVLVVRLAKVLVVVVGVVATTDLAARESLDAWC